MNVVAMNKVAIVVQDLDKVLAWFKKIGVDVKEVYSPVLEQIGARVGCSLKYQMEIIMPPNPLPDDCPPHLKKFSEQLGGKEIAIAGLTFRVDDQKACIENVKRMGIETLIEAELAEHAMNPLGHYVGLKECIFKEEGTLGMNLSFIQYEKFIPNSPE